MNLSNQIIFAVKDWYNTVESKMENFYNGYSDISIMSVFAWIKGILIETTTASAP